MACECEQIGKEILNGYARSALLNFNLMRKRHRKYYPKFKELLLDNRILVAKLWKQLLEA